MQPKRNCSTLAMALRPGCINVSIWPKIYRWCLTHWGRVTHICVGNLTIIGSENGLLPDRRQAIIWANAGILLIRPQWNCNRYSNIFIQEKASENIVCEMASIWSRPQCVNIIVIFRYWGVGGGWWGFEQKCVIRLYVNIKGSFTRHVTKYKIISIQITRKQQSMIILLYVFLSYLNIDT